MSNHPHNYPKLHNAAWPGLVGKGAGGEPPIDLDTMLDLTAAAESTARASTASTSSSSSPFRHRRGDEEVKRLAEKARMRNLDIGSVVAPVYPATGGGCPWEAKRINRSSWPSWQGVPRCPAVARTGRAARRRRADRFGL